MKRKLFAIFLTVVMTLNVVLSSGLNVLGASVTLAAPELTLKSYATKAVLSWNYNSKADGYQIYWCGGDTSSVPHNNQSGNCWNERVKLKTISSNNTTSYTKTDLSYKKNYHFKVRAYKKSGSSVIYSGWSDEECTIDTVNRLNAASLKTRTSYKTINVQGEKNTLFADHTLTDKEKIILGNFAKSHFKDDWTPGEKIQYTAEWIRNNMTYLHDYSQIKTYSYTENIFKYKEGQCSDYNGALIEMMIYLGFDARLIMGYRNGSVQHFWGEVIIDGSVFLMEVGEKASDSPQWGYKWMFLCNTYSEADGGYYKNGKAAKDSIASYPAVVTGLKVSSKTINSINLEWSKASGAAGYDVYQYNNTQKKWTKIVRTASSENTYKVSNLSAGTEYKFAVKAYKTANGQEIYSVSLSTLTAVTNPASVTGFKVNSMSDNSVNLTWNKVKSAEGYIIYQYNNSKKAWSRIAKTTTTANSFKMTNLNAGTEYKFAVRAYRTENGKEITSPSYPALNTVTKPAAITAFKVTSVSANSVNLTWNQVNSAEGYIVYQYNDSKKAWNRTAKIKGTSYTVSKLSSGTSYKFAVKPYLTFEGKEVGCAKYMEVFTSTLPDKVKFMVKTYSDKTTVTWDKVNGATGYIVYYKKNSNDNWHKLTVTSGTSYTNSGLKRNKNYIFAVKAYRIAGGQTYNGKYYTSAFPYIVNKNGLTYVDGILIANKTYGLPTDYNPGLTEETKKAFENMSRDAAKENISLFISSGFRSYNYQKTLYNGYVNRDGKKAAEKYSARPGYSEHQTGLAIDVNNPSSSFINTKEAKWLEKNCWKYGFIIRYPKGKENITGYQYEPWHIRYVGTSLAKTLTENKLTIEEFYSITSEYSK